MWVWSLGQEDLLKKEMATNSSILAWRIPWTESLGLQRVRRDWGINTSTSSGANSKNQLCVYNISFNFILLDSSTNVSCPLSFPNTLQTPLELRAHGFCMQHGMWQVLKNWFKHLPKKWFMDMLVSYKTHINSTHPMASTQKFLKCNLQS